MAGLPRTADQGFLLTRPDSGRSSSFSAVWGFYEFSQPIAMVQMHFKTFSFFSLHWVMHSVSFGLASASQQPGERWSRS